jgi:hypothetical protein
VVRGRVPKQNGTLALFSQGNKSKQAVPVSQERDLVSGHLGRF